MGTPSNVTIGPGELYVAAVGTSEPATATAAIPSSWREVGYTEDGKVVSYEFTNEAIEVEEEFDPVRYAVTGRRGMVTLQLAEATAANLALALNLGATDPGGDIEPPDPGDETRVAVLVKRENGAVWILRKCLQVGTVEIAGKKAPDKSLIPVEFALEKPDSGAIFTVMRSITPVAGLI